MSMPAQKPGRSFQSYQTPPAFLAAVKKRFHIDNFAADLAADKQFSGAPNIYTEVENSLRFDLTWNFNGWAWLNPPYAEITVWVKKAWDEAQLGAHITMLVPASVGSNWWREFVHDKAHVIFLNGRLQFVGADGPYPKDSALLLYSPEIRGGYAVWSWKE